MWTKRRMVLTYVLALVLIVAVAIGPLVSVIIASSIASSAGCRLDEAGIYPCIIQGSDMGGTLATMAILGWLMLLTFPLGAVLFLVWLVVLLVHISLRGRKRAALQPGNS